MNLGAVGVLVSVGGLILVHFGFSSGCASEITQVIPVLIGGAMTWAHGVTSGQHTVAGISK